MTSPAPRRRLLAGLAFVAAAVAAGGGAASELRIATWNLEHLDDTDRTGCVPRRTADYRALRRRVTALAAHVVAFQEVENAAAARRVFPEAKWHLELSSRPAGGGSSAPCRQRPSARLGHLATGFAVRRGTVHRRHRDLAALGSEAPAGRWGTDISVLAGGRELRLLSVHLISGCWGAEQDADPGRAAPCAELRRQLRVIKRWADARRSEGTPFVILGDFNRRLAAPNDRGWRILSPPAAPLHLPASGIAFACDPRFEAFVDHFVIGGGAEAMLVPGSFREAPRTDPHPDHCALVADFALSPHRRAHFPPAATGGGGRSLPAAGATPRRHPEPERV